MGLVDGIQQRAERSAAARQARATTRPGGKPRAPRRPPAPPLNQLERRLGFAVAALVAVAFVAIWVPHLGEMVPKVVAKAGKAAPRRAASPSSELVFGLVLAAILGWSTVIKKRWILAFVAFYSGLQGPWTSNYKFLGYAVMVFGAWLLFRNAKMQSDAQKAANAAAGRSTRPGSKSPTKPAYRSGSPARSRAVYATKPSAGSPRSTRGPSGKRQAPARARAAKAARGSKAEAPEKAAPAPSKRYTPAQAGDRRERRERREGVRTGAANRSAPPKV